MQIELTELRRSGEWRQRWRSALREDVTGLPDRYPFLPSSSGNLIHHAYSLFRFELATGKRIEDFSSIIEFGGGYGSFCRLARRLGFRGKYIIFDLPEYYALQTYFISSVGLPIVESDQLNVIECINESAHLAETLKASTGWLFIGLWSISEVPETLRDKILGEGTPISDYLIAYQDSFGGVDNVAYFKGLTRVTSDITWLSSNIIHLPGNRYLFGVKES